MTTPLILVSGFLGSGKTTLLETLARQAPQRRLLFVVNEFSNVDVDGARLRIAGVETIAIAGGSIFCRCLVSDFIARLQQVAAVCALAQPPIEAVVIEASGMSDPRTIGSLLCDTHLDRDFTLARLIAVLDPVRFLKLAHTLPALRAQIEAADLIVINKVDLCTADETTAAEALARAWQPGAVCHRAVRGAVPWALLAGGRVAPAPTGECAPCRDPHFDTLVATPPAALDLEALGAALRDQSDAIFRAKGFVATPGGPCYFDYAGRRIEIVPAPAARPDGLVFVVRGTASEHLRAGLIADLNRGRYTASAAARDSA